MKTLLVCSIAVISLITVAQETPPPPPVDLVPGEVTHLDTIASEELNERVVSLLKGMDTLSLEGFLAAFITEKETERMINEMDVDEAFKQRMREHPQRKFLEEFGAKMYAGLKMKGKEFHLNWEDIEKDEIEDNAKIRNGIAMLDGKITFWKGDTLYGVLVEAIYVDQKYCIGGLDRLSIAGGRGGFGPPPETNIEEVPEPERTDIEKYGSDLTIDDSSEVEEKIYDFPDVEAEFPGGTKALHQFIIEHIQYPDEDIEPHTLGRIYLSFVVEKDGDLTHITVERGVSPALDKEAKRLVSSMPNWKPGEFGGKAVRTRYRIPINIEIAD